jgi:hypothetical protein
VREARTVPRPHRRPRIGGLALAAVLGVGFVAIAVFSSGKVAAYVFGLLILAGVAVGVVAGLINDRSKRLAIGIASVVSAAALAAGIVIPQLALADADGDVLVTFDPGGDLYVAATVEDALVLEVESENGTQQLVVVGVESGRERGRHRLPGSATYVFGRGPVAAVSWTGSGEYAAFGVDGSELWRTTLDRTVLDPSPVAVLDDGTVVIERHKAGDDVVNELVGIAPDGRELWLQDMPFDHRIAVSAHGRRQPPSVPLVVRDNPIQNGVRKILTIERDAGVLAEFGQAWDAVTGSDYVALLDRDGDRCHLRIVVGDAEAAVEADVDCSGGGDDLWFAPYADYVTVSTDAEGTVSYVDVATGDVEDHDATVVPEFASTPFPGEPADVRRVGGPVIAPPDDGWTLSTRSNQDTVRLLHRARSYNPVRSTDPVEVVLYDVASGQRCAAARFDFGDPDPWTLGLPGCRALVGTDDTVTLIGER